MSFLPLNELPELFPNIEGWVKSLEIQAVSFGKTPLAYHPYARQAGVELPYKIHILPVTCIPQPKHPRFAELAQSIGLLTNETGGITAGYGILIRSDCINNLKLIVHECVHLAQYERLGMTVFLRQYIGQLAESGYKMAQFEIEAEIKSNEILKPKP